MKRSVVKIGTNVITRNDGSLDITQMSSLVDQISELHKNRFEVIMVSSGSVACGRSLLPGITENLDTLDQRQLFSAVGQAKLIDLYYTLFKEHNIAIGQVLTTKESLSGKKQMENQYNCMSVMIKHRIIPIINENDTIAITELMFTDNDELAGLVAQMMEADCLVLLTNVDGIYKLTKGQDAVSADLSNAEIIREVHPNDDIEKFITKKKSARGRGGMITKESVAIKAAKSGIEAFIANGRKNGIITDLMNNPQKTVSTRFIPVLESVQP